MASKPAPRSGSLREPALEIGFVTVEHTYTRHNIDNSAGLEIVFTSCRATDLPPLGCGLQRIRARKNAILVENNCVNGRYWA